MVDYDDDDDEEEDDGPSKPIDSVKKIKTINDWSYMMMGLRK